MIDTARQGVQSAAEAAKASLQFRQFHRLYMAQGRHPTRNQVLLCDLAHAGDAANWQVFQEAADLVRLDHK